MLNVITKSSQGANDASQVVVLNEVTLLNIKLCQERDPHTEIEFYLDEKHIH